MANNILHQSEKNTTIIGKRNMVLAAMAQEIVGSDDDDYVADGMNICNIVENRTDEGKQKTSALHALGETIRKTLLEINEIREQNRERRHREMLEILAKMAQQENTTTTDVNNATINQQPAKEQIRIAEKNRLLKKDMEELRAQMLEAQRKKMEDRERKNRELYKS